MQHSTGVCQEGCLCNTRLACARRAGCVTLDWRVPGGLSVPVQHSTGVCREGCLCNTRLACARRAVCATLDWRVPGGLSVLFQA